MIRSDNTKSFLRSWFCIGVNPVNSSNTITLSFMIPESSATSHNSDNTSSAVIYCPLRYSEKLWYMTEISCIFRRRVSPTSSVSKNVSNFSGDTLYCVSSEMRDFTSLMYPIRFKLPPSTLKFFFCSPASFRSTRFFPVSSSTRRFCFPSSSNTRYARRAKLSTSTFIMACDFSSRTSSRCVCMVNCSGTSTR